jgi:hypothetical protein
MISEIFEREKKRENQLKKQKKEKMVRDAALLKIKQK